MSLIYNIFLFKTLEVRKYAVNKYPEAVQTVLGKTMETCPWGTHIHGEKAMQLVSVQDVMGKIEMVLKDI